MAAEPKSRARRETDGIGFHRDIAGVVDRGRDAVESGSVRQIVSRPSEVGSDLQLHLIIDGQSLAARGQRDEACQDSDRNRMSGKRSADETFHSREVISEWGTYVDYGTRDNRKTGTFRFGLRALVRGDKYAARNGLPRKAVPL